MNNLDKLRDEKASELNEIAYEVFNNYPNDKSSYELAVNRGWDAYEALNLPVEFAKWLRVNYSISKGQYRHRGDFYRNDKRLSSEKELYDYWINNIYTL